MRRGYDDICCIFGRVLFWRIRNLADGCRRSQEGQRETKNTFAGTAPNAANGSFLDPKLEAFRFYPTYLLVLYERNIFLCKSFLNEFIDVSDVNSAIPMVLLKAIDDQ